MQDLIHHNQTGFIQGRYISENFISARELAKHLHDSKAPGVLLKIDFKRAFDSVNWEFLFSIMRQRGFPSGFYDWIKAMLSTATSSILLDGKEGPAFKHTNGLRQGDPLSPYLFLLAADVMQRIVQAISTSIPFGLSSRYKDPVCMLQYADDTMLFVTARGKSLQAISFGLQVFSKISGLNINVDKSSFVPFNLSHNTTEAVSRIFQFQQCDLPLDYLGLPLTINKPKREQYYVLIQKVQRRVVGWRCKMLSRAGRLQLCKAVLNSIPCYYMSVFLLPKWVTKEIDKLCRQFLWQNSSSVKRGVSLISWERVCTPKALGGLGLINLQIQNKCLLLRWWWKLHEQQPSLWKRVASTIFSRLNVMTTPLLWKISGSFFWKSLFGLRYLFQFSTRWTVGSGASVSFWFDNWGGAPLCNLLNSSCQPSMHKFISLSRAINKRLNFLHYPATFSDHHVISSLSQLHLMPTRDVITWKWSSSGNFNVAGLYRTLQSSGKCSTHYTAVWSLKVTPTLKLFLYFLLSGRLLTQDVLLRRGIVIAPKCQFCLLQQLETHRHLFSDCTTTASFLHDLCQHINYNTATLSQHHTLLDQFSSDLLKKEGTFKLVVIVLAFHYIWKERNSRVFCGKSQPLHLLKNQILKEATWMMKLL